MVARGGGLEVSGLTFYTNNPSSNPAGLLNFLYEKTKINGKDAGVGPPNKSNLYGCITSAILKHKNPFSGLFSQRSNDLLQAGRFSDPRSNSSSENKFFSIGKRRSFFEAKLPPSIFKEQWPVL